MSVRDYAVLYLGASRRSGGGTAGGGNVLTAAGPHRLDGPEHTAPSSTRTDLNATTSSPGLVPVLSGDTADALLGDGTWGEVAGGMVPFYIAADDAFTVPEFKQALFADPIEVDGGLIVNGVLIGVD